VYLSKDLEELELYISIGQLTSNGYSVLISDEGNFTIHMAQNFNHIVGRGVLDRSRMAYMVTFLNDSVLECESTEISKEDLMDEDKIDDEIKVSFCNFLLLFQVYNFYHTYSLSIPD